MKQPVTPWRIRLAVCGLILLAVSALAYPALADVIIIVPFPVTGLGANLSGPGAEPLVAASATSWGVTRQFQEESYYFKDLVCAAPDACLAVGTPHWDDSRKAFRATIVRSVDQGKTWQALDAGVGLTLWAVAFPDSQHAWAVGDGGAILRTADGGATWTRQTVATEDPLVAVAFADALHGWAASVRITHLDYGGEPDDWRTTLWRTVDGGATWTKSAAPADMSLAHDIEAVDASHVWAVGVRVLPSQSGSPQHRATMWRTADGGASWQAAYASDLEVSLTAVDFVDATHGWAAGFPTRSSDNGGAIFRTTDGGATWDRLPPGNIFAPLWDIRFLDRNRGYAVGFDYVGAWGPPVWRTMDGGATWTKVRMSRHEGNGLFGVAVFEKAVIALGDHDYLARSDDPWAACPNELGCKDCECFFTQRFLNTHYTLHDVSFADASTGCAVGAKSTGIGTTGQVILRTTDGGRTWTERHADAAPGGPSYYRLDSVAFADALHGWAAGASRMGATTREHHNALLRTDDGGATWREQGQELFDSWNLEFPAIEALSAQEAWALAVRHPPESTVYLAHTTDGGAHWTWVDTGIEANVAVGYAEPQGALHFEDAQRGWVGAWNAVLRTTDGGRHWTKLTLDCGYSLCYPASQAIDFAGATGWLAGDNLWRSDDGVTWKDMKIEPHAQRGQPLQFYDVQFLDEKNGWAAGNGGALLYTSTGGDRWGRARYATTYNINGIDFLDPQHGWMVGGGGVIMKVDLPKFPPVTTVFLPSAQR